MTMKPIKKWFGFWVLMGACIMASILGDKQAALFLLCTLFLYDAIKTEDK